MGGGELLSSSFDFLTDLWQAYHDGNRGVF